MSKYLQEGDIIEIKEGHRVYADIPMHFAFSNRRGCFDLTHHDVAIDDNFNYLAGEYIVVKTSKEGGGTGVGVHDVYPDGYHVYCEREDGQKVDFYQSGCFTAMITDIKPIGKATRKWTKLK